MSAGLPRLLSLPNAVSLINGQSAIIDTTELRNPFRSGMWMHSMRFQVERSTLAALSAPLVQAQFWLGRHQFSAGVCPIYTLDRIYNPLTDMGRNSMLTGADGTSTEVAFPNWQWKFQKPLYVPEGAVVVPKLYNNSGVTVQVRLTYVCQEAPGPAPQELYIPFAANFIGAGGVGGANVFTDISQESDLLNPFDEPVFVRRMVGRVAKDRTSDAQYSDQDLVGLGLKVRMSGSSGRAVVRDPVPFNHLFPTTHRQWLTNSVLAPRGYYVVAVEQDYSAFGGLSANRFQPVIGMSGYRKVRAQL